MTDLQPKLITPVGQYDKVEWQGRNTSGIMPFGDRVLVLPDQPATKYGSILLPPAEIERVALAAETGVLVAQGDGAWYWNSDRTRKYEGAKPVPGQRVYFERYAGAQFHGQDGVVYRLMDDKAIGGFAVEPEEAPPLAPDELPTVAELAEGPKPRHVSEALKLQDAITRGHEELAGLPEVEAPPLTPEHTPVLGDPNAVTGGVDAATAAFSELATRAAFSQPIEPKFPRFTVRDGQMLMAFNHQDMKDKAPEFIWFDSAEEAKTAAGFPQ